MNHLWFSPCSSRMFARRRKPTFWDFSINCTGNEAHLSSCKLGHTTPLKSNGTCAGGLPVVVSCVPGRAFAPTPMTGFRKAFRQEVKLSLRAFPVVTEADMKMNLTRLNVWVRSSPTTMFRTQCHFLSCSCSRFGNYSWKWLFSLGLSAMASCSKILGTGEGNADLQISRAWKLLHWLPECYAPNICQLRLCDLSAGTGFVSFFNQKTFPLSFVLTCS